MRRTMRRTAPAVRGSAGKLPRRVKVMVRLPRRGLPEPVCPVGVEPDIEVPAADGTVLLTDHYVPLIDGPRPALLVRSPYGRGFPWDYLYGALFAGQGFHVVIQSCRGTGGSGGDYEPGRDERADGRAAVAWLRQQEWFDGRLGTIGPSYLGYTQWALAADAPPELGAMVVQVGIADLRGILYPGGAFGLETALNGTAAMLSMQRGFGRFALAMTRLLRTHRRVERTLPLIDAYPAAFGRRVAFFEQWLAHPEADDPFWRDLAAGTLAGRQTAPVSLITGWWDICLDQTLEQYRRLRDAGREARLIVGPWNHTSGFNQDQPILFGEALAWLRAYLCDDHGAMPEQPVRVHVGEPGGPGEWRHLPDWPPPGTRPSSWYPRADGALDDQPPAGTSTSAFTYDPSAPTPAVGGQSMNTRNVGSVRNNTLEARSDVLVFTSPPLAEPLEIIGPVSVRLEVRGSTPHFDVFARLCHVDRRGRSWNLCDGLVRHGLVGHGSDAIGAATDGDPPWSVITVPMSATAYRIPAGHRLRLQISGGAHPSFARNTGTNDPPASAIRLVPVQIQIRHTPSAPCILTLPSVP